MTYSVIFTNPEYKEAITGVTESGNVLYDFDKMVECLSRKDGISEMDATEFVEFNSIRSIPYSPDPRPIIFYPISN